MMEGRVHALIGDISDGAMDSDIVPVMLRRMCTLTRSPCGLFAVHNDRMIVHSVYAALSGRRMPEVRMNPSR